MYVYEHHFISLSGSRLSLDRFRGQPLLLVNISTERRFAPQLLKLQALWENYRHFGLEVIGLPCDDFTDSKFASDEDLAFTLRSRFGIRFPLTARQHLVGHPVSPLFEELRELHGQQIMPRCSFCKYLFDQRGSLAGNWSHQIEPDHTGFTQAIERNLKAWII
jgi:glutathione peroxidase